MCGLALVENEQRIRQAARGFRKLMDAVEGGLHDAVRMTQEA